MVNRNLLGDAEGARFQHKAMQCEAIYAKQSGARIAKRGMEMKAMHIKAKLGNAGYNSCS